MIEKFGKFREAVGKLYDHSNNRYLDYAHCLVTLLSMLTTMAIVSHFALTFIAKKKIARKPTSPFGPKIEIAKELIN